MKFKAHFRAVCMYMITTIIIIICALWLVGVGLMANAYRTTVTLLDDLHPYARI